MKSDEERAEEYAEEKHISAIVDRPESNILFAKKLSRESYLDGLKEGRRLRWIPVSEGLPTEEEFKTKTILVRLFAGGEGRIRTGIIGKDDTGRGPWWCCGFEEYYCLDIVTHWMPITGPEGAE